MLRDAHLAVGETVNLTDYGIKVAILPTSRCSTRRARVRRSPNCVSRSRCLNAASALSRGSALNCIVPPENKPYFMVTRTLRIAMDGITGRLGTNQH